MWTVDIDVGGTLTDGLFTSGDTVFSVKVDTTPHDLTLCLVDCLSRAATTLGFDDAVAFLDEVDLIRWSTTITSNVLAELRGPRIGLLISQGHENDLYAPDGNAAALNRFLDRRDVVGVRGAATDTEIMNAARSLLESGVRRICISLQHSHQHPERELSYKRTIDQQYPDHFLGSVPVLAGSDISQSADDRTRTACAVINAYSHGALAATLFKAEDELRQTSKYAGTFLVSHINGGVAGIAKTKAIDTIESGPVLGVLGSAYLAKTYGLNDVVAMDIGGTTAKISVLGAAGPIYRKPSDLFGIPLEMSLPYLRSIALGGGSVVKIATGGAAPSIQLGPESQGSYPGPACYGLGGDQPTLTDAFVAAGLINPEYFLGGTKPIDTEAASAILGKVIAQPLHLSIEETCRKIIDRAFEMVAGMIANAQTELHRDFSEHTLFAYGGNGGLFACGVADKAKLKNVQMFALGSVFSAFGSSVSDICHVYERALPESAITEDGVKLIRQMLEETKAEATKDLLGEGIRPEHLSYEIEFEVAGSDRHSIPAACDEGALRGAAVLKTALSASLAASGGHAVRPAEISLELLRVRVKKLMLKPRATEQARQGPDSSHARIGSRKILWGGKNGEAQLYRWESLQPGNRIEGSAILEGINTTYFIPGGWVMTIDGFGNANVRRS